MMMRHLPAEYPPWLKVKAVDSDKLSRVEEVLQKGELNTICESARCPNLCECFARKTATFLILGKICNRSCRFCAVPGGLPEEVDRNEPRRLAEAVKTLGLDYVVITSVTRDDLPDGGAGHFARCVQAVREINRNVSIEVLIPDLQGNRESLRTVVLSRPEVINHNLETVERLYPVVRPGADYRRSINILEELKRMDPSIYTKTGLMLGIGEKEEEVVEAFHHLRSADCDILTLGQYLSPSPEHVPVDRFVEPAEFERLKNKALQLGFRSVASAPLVRSSYRARDILDDISR